MTFAKHQRQHLRREKRLKETIKTSSFSLKHTTVRIYRRNDSTNGTEHLELVKEGGFRHIEKMNSGSRVSFEKLML